MARPRGAWRRRGRGGSLPISRKEAAARPGEGRENRRSSGPPQRPPPPGGQPREAQRKPLIERPPRSLTHPERLAHNLIAGDRPHGEMGDPGLEPGTSSLSEKRSNRLS